MSEILVLVSVVVLVTGGYAVGRVHGLYGYRMGYRFGYRQGYFDGDRASWGRQRTDLASVSALLSTPPSGEPTSKGTTYASTAAGEELEAGRRVRTEWVLSGGHGRPE